MEGFYLFLLVSVWMELKVCSIKDYFPLDLVNSVLGLLSIG